MSAKDKFHDSVKNALIKDGWTITADPLQIKLGDIDAYIDLGAEKLLTAEKNGEKIAVEIKSFLGASNIYDFYLAFGQFLNYREALNKQEPERVLFLAVPDSVHETFFKNEFILEMVEKFELKLVSYNIETEEIVKWTK
ncbi:MAG: XisH family protein [Pyrinomonadaceae bacterium]